MARHRPNFVDHGLKIQLTQNLGLQVDPWSDFQQFNPFGDQPKDGSLGDKQHIMLATASERATERNLLDLIQEFSLGSFADNL